MSKLISVIITNYNYEKYIEEAIDSVLNQTYKNFQIIIVDDGSTDNSREVIKEYKNKYDNLITIVFKENGGQASAFNAGYKLVKGEIIAFLDSDDYWFPQKLERIVRAHEEYDVVEHGMLCSGEFCRWTQEKSNAHDLLKKNGELLLFSETSSLSFSKKLLDVIFPIPEEEVKICAETFVLLEAVYYSNKIKTLRECLSFYRIHGGNGYFNNPNADKQHFVKFISIFNSILKSKNLPIIIFGIDRVIHNLKSLKFNSENKYAIYGLGKVGETVSEYLIRQGCQIAFYIDSNEKYRDIEREIYHYKDLVYLNNKYDYIIIASSYVREIRKNLRSIPILDEKMIILY